MTRYILNGKELRTLRSRNNMSQRQLADKVGFTGPSSIVRIEKGERAVDWEKLHQISGVFGVDPQSIILESIEDDGSLSSNYTTILRAIKNTPGTDNESFEIEHTVFMDDLSKRLAQIEKHLSSIVAKEKPITISGDELTQEEIDLIKRLRASSDQQRKVALAAVNAILSENL